MNGSRPRLLQSPGDDVAKFRLSWVFPASAPARFTKNYALACFDQAENRNKPAAPMTMSVANIAEDASPMRGLLPLWVGVLIYALFLVAGNKLLIDPDTLWQITVGQWISDHRAVPETDVYSFTMHGQPWISTQWLAQVLYAKAYAISGWSGPVVLAATAIAAADRRGAPSFRLLPLMALWATLHGGFVFGLVLIAPIALDAVLNADVKLRKALALRWAAFAVAALALSCCTPYGWNSLLASQKILALGAALSLIMEWRPTEFGSVGAFEICLLLGIGLALFRGVKLPPLRIVLLLGLLHMALAQGRAVEILALLAPLVLAAPLARQIGGNEVSTSSAAAPMRGVLFASVTIALVAATLAYASVHRFEPHTRGSPVAAVTALKKLNLTRVFNDYDFGGYLIANGVATFIDGRTELYGEKFFIDDIATIHLRKQDALHTIEPAVDVKAK